MATKTNLKGAEAALSKAALAYPETYEEHPWSHRAIKVNGKSVAFFSLEKDRFSLSVKLPTSSAAAVMLPFASPTGYGLGKSGWVTAQFTSADKIPLDLLREWFDESYRAIAPKRLVAKLADRGAAPAARVEVGRAAAKSSQQPARRPKKKSTSKPDSRGDR